MKMVELALLKLVNGIATGEVKGAYSDVDRLIRLKVFLEEPETGAAGPQAIVVNLIRSGGIDDSTPSNPALPPRDSDV